MMPLRSRAARSAFIAGLILAAGASVYYLILQRTGNGQRGEVQDSATNVALETRTAPVSVQVHSDSDRPVYTEATTTDSAPLTQVEKKRLEETLLRVKSAFQDIERSNATVIRKHNDDALSLAAVVVTQPTPEQFSMAGDVYPKELANLSDMPRIQNLARDQIDALLNSFFGFKNSKYKILVPTIYEGGRPPRFMVGFTDNHEITMVSEETTANSNAPGYATTPLMRLPALKESVTTMSWSGNDSLFKRYKYLFEVSSPAAE